MLKKSEIENLREKYHLGFVIQKKPKRIYLMKRIEDYLDLVPYMH